MNYYVVTNGLFEDSIFAFGEQVKSKNLGESVKCQECGTHLRMLKWLPPLEVNISKNKLGDFIFGTFVGIVVSNRFKTQYQNSNLKGLDDFRKVSLFHKDKHIFKDYYYPEITMAHVSMDLQYLDFKPFNPCSSCYVGNSILNRIDKIVLSNPNQINLDIFFTSILGEGTILISQRFKDFVETEKFTNLKMIKSVDYKWDSLNPINY
ncbi:MAG: hypothetical protein AB3N16_15075 [Flavobacteriaceae bacterium]